MKSILAIVTVMAIVASASAVISNPHVAGGFQGWDPAASPMTETSPGSGIWTATFTGVIAGRYEYKITDGTWSNVFPGSANCWVYVDGSGTITLTYDTNTYTDGWVPTSERLGQSSSPAWTATGSFQSQIGGADWNNANPNTAMTLQSGGVYSLQTTALAPGNYEWKACATGTWDSISWDGRSVNTANMAFTVYAASTTTTFWVDNVRGCVKVDVVIPSGACCIGGVCSIKTLTDCTAQSGQYIGNDTECTANTCATGACCAGASCAVVLESQCALIPDSRFMGVGTDCLSGLCPTIGTPHIAGDFQLPTAWDAAANPMVETAPSSFIWTYTVTGLVAGSRHEFKITDGTWAHNLPSSNSWFYADDFGNCTVTYNGNIYADGWAPNRDRLGLNTDPGTWTAIGDFQSELAPPLAVDWNNTDPLTLMAAQGAGQFKVELTGIPAGSYVGRPVKTGTYADGIGWDGRRTDAPNMTFTTTATTDTVKIWADNTRGCMKIDVSAAPPTGACCYYSVPQPPLSAGYYTVACIDATLADCTAIYHGTFHGVGNMCGTVSCPIPVCHGDCDCDGYIGFNDIDYFVAMIPDAVDAWTALYQARHTGAAPPCAFLNGDMDGNLHVGFTDIDGFVASIPSTCPLPRP